MLPVAFRHRFAVLVLLVLPFVLSAPVVAQDGALPPAAVEGPSAGGLSADDLERLIATLEDDAARQQFLDTLRTARIALAGAPPEETRGLGLRLLGEVSAGIASASAEMANLAVGAASLPVLVSDLGQALDTPAERQALTRGLTAMAVAVAAGLLAAWLAGRLLARPRRALSTRPGARWVERIGLLVGRLVLALVPPAVLAVVAWAVVPLMEVGPRLEVGLSAFIAALALFGAVLAVARTLLAPADMAQAVLPISDETGAYLVIWVQRLAAVVLFGGALLQAAALAGLPDQSYAVLLKVLGLLVAVLGIVLVLQNRQPVAAWLRGNTATSPPGERIRRPGQRLRQRLADVWHVLVVVYLVALFAVWAADVADGFTFMLRATALTVVVIALAVALAHGLGLMVARAFRVSAEKRARFPGLEERANRHIPAFHAVLRGALVLVTALAVAEIWGLQTLSWLTAGPGQRLTGAVLSIALVLLLAFIAWSMVSSAIERYLGQAAADGTVVERSARAKTLLPLARNVFLVVLVVIVGLIVLSEIGVNIAPLLAGAGVIGLAIGFGSQKLVQDVITGAFILIEDSISVGDVVSVGGNAGVVEAITIRSLRLRDATGSVHTMPFSTVDKVTNLTKEFSFAVLDIGVAYREDTDEVFEVMKEVAEDLRADPAWGPLILEPLEVQGVDGFADSAVLLKARMKTLPIRQWAVRREFNRRLKKAFDARGIEIPFPQSTVWFGEDKGGKAPAGRLIVQQRDTHPDPGVRGEPEVSA